MERLPREAGRVESSRLLYIFLQGGRRRGEGGEEGKRGEVGKYKQEGRKYTYSTFKEVMPPQLSGIASSNILYCNWLEL